MPIPTTGPISAAMIRAEFGGSGVFYLNQYYRGGPRVPNTAANANIPTSGPISFGNFRGASAISPLSAVASPSHHSRNLAVNESVTVISNINVTGGVPPYTYSSVWRVAPAGVGTNIINAAASNPGVTSQGRANGQVRTWTVNTTVVDAVGSVAVAEWSGQFQWGTIL